VIIIQCGDEDEFDVIRTAISDGQLLDDIPVPFRVELRGQPMGGADEARELTGEDAEKWGNVMARTSWMRDLTAPA
jgi:hypothetical protein